MSRRYPSMVAPHAAFGQPSQPGALPSRDDTAGLNPLRLSDAVRSRTPAPSDQDASQAQGEVERIVLDMDFANTPPIDWTESNWARIAAALYPAPGATAQDGVEPVPAYVVKFLHAVDAAPGCKHPVDRYYPEDDENAEASWEVAEKAGWVTAVGSHKWKITPAGHAIIATPTPTIPAGKLGVIVRAIKVDLASAPGRHWFPVKATDLRALLDAAAHKQAEQRLDAATVERWQSMDSAPRDGSEFWALTDDVHGTGLSPFVSKCEWHPDAGFCTDELREPILWRALATDPHQHGAGNGGEA